MENNYVLKIAVIEDDEIFLKLISERIGMEDNVDVHSYSTAEDFWKELHLGFHLVIVDYELPYTNGIELLQKIKKDNFHISTAVLSGQKDLSVVVEAYKKGAYRYIIKNDNAIVEVLQTIETVRNDLMLKNEIEKLKDGVIESHRYENIVGESPEMQKVFKLMQKVENITMPILVTGDNGTGKELVARALHFNSDRKRKPFIAVNVAAIPEDLIESELFGSEKGAYTGATKRSGKFEEADRGTIFLDEIAEMALPVQAKLLRILQENKVTRLGGNKEIDLDIKVISATNKDLWAEVQAGNFREDLYFRLQGFIIELPALADRGNDVILLAKKFNEAFSKKQGQNPKPLSNSAMREMLTYNWPGNVRELKSMIERAAIISDGDQITENDLVFLDQSSTADVAVGA